MWTLLQHSVWATLHHRSVTQKQRQVRRARRHELAASAAQPGVEDMSLSDSSNSEEDTGGVHDKCQKTITDLRAQLKSRDDEIANLRGKVERLESSVRDRGFGAAMLSAPANVKVADARVRFLTGFMTLAAFSFFCGFLKDRCKTLCNWMLSADDVLLMVLMKLRLNFPNQYLALRFGVSTAHVSRTIRGVLPELAKALSFLVQWPSRDVAIRCMPKQVRRRYGMFVRGIIDCTEIFVATSSDFKARSVTWSNYKHHNTLKCLVAISPNGGIMFASRFYGGRTSDNVITCRSDFLDMLEPLDVILADRGFTLEDEFMFRNCKLVIPAFTRGKKQLSARDVEETRQLANIRIHVERAMERIKNFRILSDKVPLYLVPHVDNIMMIVCALSNLMDPLVK